MARIIPPRLDTFGEWRRIEKSSTIVWRRRGFYYNDGVLAFDSDLRQYREEYTETWEVPVSDTQDWPDGIIDPGGLIAAGWKCEDRRFTAPYGTPLARSYRETFRKIGPWTTVE